MKKIKLTVLFFVLSLMGVGYVSADATAIIERTGLTPYSSGADFQIQGIANWTGLGRYRIFVSQMTDPYEWYQVGEESYIPSPKSRVLADKIPVGLLKNGANAISLRVFGSSFSVPEAEDIWEFDFKKPGEISYPSNNDVFRKDALISIEGFLKPYRDFKIEWGVGVGDKEWSDLGIHLSIPKSGGNFSGTLASWNTTFLPTNEEFFRLQLTVQTQEGKYITQVHQIRLDPQLKSGWPVYQSLTDMHVRIADLDKDGKKEVLLFGNKSDLSFSFTVLDQQGKRKWKGQHKLALTAKPVIGNFDSDPFDEIVVSLGERRGSSSWTPQKIVVFNHDGSKVSEYRAEARSLTLGDLNRDGISELIVVNITDEEQPGSGSDLDQIIVFDHNFNIQGKTGYILESIPSIGNFDDNPDLEFVSSTGENGEVAIYNEDGSILRRFFVEADYSSPYYPRVNDSVVGDLDADGFDDIVLLVRERGNQNHSKVHVVNREGHPFGGEWPREGHHGSPDDERLLFPVLADLENDGDLEIGVIGSPCYFGTGLYFFDHAGRDLWDVYGTHGPNAHVILDGFAHPSANSSGFIIGDMTGDNIPNILLTHRSHMNDLGDMRNYYGHGILSEINVWDSRGHLVDLNPSDRTELFLESQNVVESLIDDIDGDGKLELIAISESNRSVFPNADFDSGLVILPKNRGSIYVFDFNTDYNPQSHQWPTHRGDNQHSGHHGGFNKPPVVYAGADKEVGVGSPVRLDGLVVDDHHVSYPNLQIKWSDVSNQVIGKFIQINDPTSPTTTAVFSKAGTYILQLKASDGEFKASDQVQFHVKVSFANEDSVKARNIANLSQGEKAEIGIQMHQPGHATVTVYDRRGHKIKEFASQSYGAGYSKLVWDGTDGSGARVASGIYTIICQSGDGEVQKSNVIISN